MSIIIERDGRVVVRAPLETSSEKIEQLVSKKKPLIRKKLLQKHRQSEAGLKKEFVSGESLLFLGTQYQLSIIEEDFDAVRFDNRFMISRSKQEEANQLFKAWYKQKAKDILVPKASAIAKQLGVTYQHLDVREIRYRWGSCTPKDNIHLNWRLIKAPMFVIEYIIIHELTHLLETDHTPQFWNRVAAQQPGYKKAKEWLKDNGFELERDF